MLTKILLVTLLFALITIIILVITIKAKSGTKKKEKEQKNVFQSYNKGVKDLYETACKINRDNIIDAFNECLAVLRKYTDTNTDNN